MQWLFERTIEIAAWVAMIVAWVTAVLAAMWLVQWFATLKTGADYELLMCSAKAAGAFVGFSLALGALAAVAAGAAGIVDLDSSFQENPLFERLLASQRETIVGRITWPDAFEENTTAPGSQLLFVVNGSFLLNLPLVNHEHRKLAQRLITACGPPGRLDGVSPPGTVGTGRAPFHHLS